MSKRFEFNLCVCVCVCVAYFNRCISFPKIRRKQSLFHTKCTFSEKGTLKLPLENILFWYVIDGVYQYHICTSYCLHARWRFVIVDDLFTEFVSVVVCLLWLWRQSSRINSLGLLIPQKRCASRLHFCFRLLFRAISCVIEFPIALKIEELNVAKFFRERETERQNRTPFVSKPNWTRSPLRLSRAKFRRRDLWTMLGIYIYNYKSSIIRVWTRERHLSANWTQALCCPIK